MNEFSNVDADEIKKFDRLAEIWWDPNGAMGMLHVVNPLRTNFIKKNASLKGKKVLDVGCGGGILTESLAREGAEATGIDLAETPLKIASQHAEQAGLSIEYLAKNVEDLARERPHAYDVVACCEALEHVPDPGKIIDCCAALLKPGGTLFFSTINRNLKSFLFAIIGAEYILGLVRRGTHTYGKFIKPAELGGWTADSGLAFKDLTGLHYNPILRKYSTGGNTHVNYLMHYRKI